MAATSGPTSNRNRIGRVLLMAGLLTILTSGLALFAESQDPIRALQRYPYLADIFPYGFWSTHQASDQRLCGAFREPSYEARREKLFHHLAHHHVNAIGDDIARAARVFSHDRGAATGPGEILDAAGKYGISLISSAQQLHSHVKHSARSGVGPRRDSQGLSAPAGVPRL